MKQITLGTTGITVPQNAFGALPIQRVSADEAVRLLEFRGQLIHHVVKHAFAELGTAVAGHAAAHGLIADLHGLDRNAALRKNFLHFPQSDGRVSVRARAAVEHQDTKLFHQNILLMRRNRPEFPACVRSAQRGRGSGCRSARSRRSPLRGAQASDSAPSRGRRRGAPDRNTY